MYYIAVVTDSAGTYARCFEGEPRLDRAPSGTPIELEVLSMTEDRATAFTAAELLQSRLERERRRRRGRAVSPVPQGD